MADGCTERGWFACGQLEKLMEESQFELGTCHSDAMLGPGQEEFSVFPVSCAVLTDTFLTSASGQQLDLRGKRRAPPRLVPAHFSIDKFSACCSRRSEYPPPLPSSLLEWIHPVVNASFRSGQLTIFVTEALFRPLLKKPLLDPTDFSNY